MALLLFIVLFVLYLGLIVFVFERVASTGKFWYLVIYVVCFLPVYQNAMIFTYQQTGSLLLVKCIQYSKEIVIFGSLLLFVGMDRNILQKPFRLHPLDWVLMAFYGLAILYVFLPLGEASFVNRAIYFKNMLLFGVIYFFGRNEKVEEKQVLSLLYGIMVVGVLAFVIASVENWTNTHLQSVIGFTNYTLEVLDDDPQGHYDLKWNFEAFDGTKRFASLFANPLELSSGMLLMFAVAVVGFRLTRYSDNRIVFFVFGVVVILNQILAYSRASFGALFIMIFFIAVILRYYRLIALGIAMFLLLVVYIFNFAPEERRDFVLDTITFADPSSLGHAIEWLQGVDSMIQSPLGIGLGMSGNAGGVEDELRVGGENQFIVFGVQLGVLGLVLYTAVLLLAIYYSYLAYRRVGRPYEQVIPFLAATVKFGLILPLFTANAETYLFVSLLTWWMVGQSIRLLERYPVKRPVLETVK